MPSPRAKPRPHRCLRPLRPARKVALTLIVAIVTVITVRSAATLGPAFSGATPGHASIRLLAPGALSEGTGRDRTLLCPGPLPAGCDGTASTAAVPGTRENSTPIPEVGAVAAWLSPGGEPYAIGYDPANGFVYITDSTGPNVTVMDNETLVARISVGSPTTSAVYDPSDGEMYLSEGTLGKGGGSVAVIDGTRLVQTLQDASFDYPYEAGYDPDNQCVYVPNAGGNTVTLIHGTTITAVLPTGRYPAAAVYDPTDRDMYVSDTASLANGGSNLTVFQNTTAVATLTGNFTNPLGEAYDAANGDLYVVSKNLANPGTSYVTVLHNLSVVGIVPTGQDAFGMVYDPANQDVYELSSSQDIQPASSDNVTVLRNLTILENLTVGSDSHFGAYDPTDHSVYVANAYNGSVAVLTTELAIGTIRAAPTGVPNGSIDVGQTESFDLTLWAVGAPSDAPSVTTAPSGGLGCRAPSLAPKFTAAELSVVCVPTQNGSYTLWLNVSDGDSNVVWASVIWQVWPDPSLGPVQPSPAVVDAGETVTFTAAVTGGDGVNVFAWSGLPPDCPPVGSAVVTCLLTTLGAFAVTVTATDGNGLVTRAPNAVPVTVLSDPRALAVSLTPASAVVDQSVVVFVGITGGDPPYSVNWSGLPPGCPMSTTERIVCAATEAGTYVISGTVSDSTHYTVAANASTLIVATAPAGVGTGGETNFLLLVALAAVGLAGAVFAVWVVWSRRGRRPTPATREPDTDP